VRAIDDELARLPDRLCLPVLLHCVQGLSREEACRRLQCSDGASREKPGTPGHPSPGHSRRFNHKLAFAFLVVEAAGPVPWTKPDELECDSKKSLPKLGGVFPGTARVDSFPPSRPSRLPRLMHPPIRIGSYIPPAVRIGRRAHCLDRGVWCRVVSWTDAPIPWPRVVPPGGRAGSSVLPGKVLRDRAAGAILDPVDRFPEGTPHRHRTGARPWRRTTAAPRPRVPPRCVPAWRRWRTGWPRPCSPSPAPPTT
jgi:hypothetical protein